MASFNFTYNPGTSLQQMLGFEMAGRIWAAYLKDDVAINIQVGVSSSLAPNILGGALPGMQANQSYESYRNALVVDKKSADDNNALNSLPIGQNFNMSFNFKDNNSLQWRTQNQTTLNMTRAVAKASGLGVSDGSTLDGYILFSNLSSTMVNGQPVSWSYDYTRSSSQAANALDFLSTAIHEIGHVLGIVSGVDQPGWLDIGMTSSQTYLDGMRNRVQYTNPFDLFRYTTTSATQFRAPDISYGSEGGAKYLSFDGGQTSIAQFSTGGDINSGGDGYQASHFKRGVASIMEPTLSLSTRKTITALDLRTFDVMGWDIAANGINTSFSLSTLQSQAIASLATRAGQTTDWVNKNLATSPTSLTADRSQDVYNMAVNSQVYDLSRVTSTTTTTSGTRITLDQALAQCMQTLGLFSTVDEIELPATVAGPALVQDSLLPSIVQLAQQYQPDSANSIAHSSNLFLTIDLSSQPTATPIKSQSLSSPAKRSAVVYYDSSPRSSSPAKTRTLPTFFLDGWDGL